MAMPTDDTDLEKLNSLTYKIRGILFKIQNDLGTKFQEKHYVRALCSLLNKENLKYELEVPFDLIYNGIKLGSFRADIIIEKIILLELKTVDYLTQDHIKQTIRYLESLNLPIGYVVNFRIRPLQIKRLINTKHLRHLRTQSSVL